MIPKSLRAAVPAIAACALFAAHAQAQCSFARLYHSHRQTFDNLGNKALSLTTYNNVPVLAAGIPDDDTHIGFNAGSVCFFVREAGNWVEFPTWLLRADDAQAFDRFGASVSYSHPWLVVGAPDNQTPAGATGSAYFYRREAFGWVEQAQMIPTGSANNDDLGAAVDVSTLHGRGVAIVGAPLHNAHALAGDAGALYFYEQNALGDWFEKHRIIFGTSDPGLYANDQMGAAVAIASDFAVAGAPNAGFVNGPANRGFAYVIQRNAVNWAVTTTLSAEDAESNDHFGAAVDVHPSTNWLAVAAPDDDRSAQEGSSRTDSGSVYIFRKVGADFWQLDTKLIAPDAAASARFGASLCFSETSLVVAAPGASKAYVYTLNAVNDWVLDDVIRDPDAEEPFASGVAAIGTSIVVGAAVESSSGILEAGALYFYSDAAYYSDSCSGARFIPGAGTYTGCTTNATLDGTSTCLGTGDDVWFLWYPTCDGMAVIDTVGSNYDTILSIHTTCPSDPDFSTLVCNDDAQGLGLASRVSFDYSPNQTYYIRVSGFNNAEGDFTLNVYDSLTTPANDACSTPAPVSLGVHNFYTCQATTDGPLESACFGGNSNRSPQSDVWFLYHAACSGETTIDLCGSNFDTTVAVYLGQGCSRPADAAFACNDDRDDLVCPQNNFTSRVTFSTVQGFQYLIRVGGFGGQTGQGVLTITCSTLCPADWDGNGLVNAADFGAFLTDYFEQLGGPGTCDLDGNEVVNAADVGAYLTLYFQAVGPCP